MNAARLHFRLSALWIVVGLAAVAVGIWRATEERSRLEQQIIDRAQRCAVAFETDDVAALSGSREDLATPAYAAVKERLMRLRAIGTGVRFVYLFRSTDEPGRVLFLADSEPAASPEISLPGDDYPEAPTSPGLQAILRTHRPATEGPLHDSYGEWVTAYAPVGDVVDGAPRVILGLDVDASHWRRELWFAGIAAGGLVFLLCGVPLAASILLARERRLNREIRRLSTAIQQSHSAVFITSPVRMIEYVNDGGAAMTGYTVEGLMGRPLSVLLSPEEQPDPLPDGSARWQGELRLRRRNGEHFPARAVLSPVRSRDGGMLNLVVVFDDISEQKKSEHELRLARDQAQSADRAKGEFLAVMSHELRTPLNGIIGFATLLQDTPLSAEQADYAETIRKSGEALLALTNELLDYSRIDAGRMQLDVQACAPRQIVEEAVELLSTRAAEKNLELITRVAPDVPSYVQADPGRLRQVLVNLVGNAIKFTPSGEVEVEVMAQAIEPDRVELEFIVRDSGIGIAAEQQHRLFKPFSQIDASATRRHGGAGLGLAISQSLVRLMGGEIDVTSAPGTGSCFRFRIAVGVVEAASPLPALPARRVVVISSNGRARDNLVGLLSGWGLNAVAYEKHTAIPALHEHDLVVVDVMAREAAGWPELLRQQRELTDRPMVGLVPIVVPGPLREELRGCFRAVLKKPLREPLLHAVLHGLMRG